MAASAISPIWPRRCSRPSEAGNAWGRAQAFPWCRARYWQRVTPPTGNFLHRQYVAEAGLSPSNVAIGRATAESCSLPEGLLNPRQPIIGGFMRIPTRSELVGEFV